MMRIDMRLAAVAAVVLTTTAFPPLAAGLNVPGCEQGKLTPLPEKAFENLRRATERRISSIRETPNMAVPEGADVRYLSEKGNDEADGKTPATAWKTIARLNAEQLEPGAFVLFERGSLFRGGGVKARKGVTYTAYGKGPKPRVYSSPEDGADPAKWEKTDAENIWRYKIGQNDVGTLVFDGGKAHAFKVLPIYNKDGTYTQQYGGKPFNNGYKDLSDDLFFWHDYSDKTDFKPFAKGTGYLYLCSKENPGKRFKSIEFNVKRNGFGVGGDDVHIDNICIMYVGAHGIGGGTRKGLHVTNCELGWIGGSIQAERIFGRRWAVRYGNAVELYGGCDDYVVDNCYVYQVYDAGLTQQINVEKPDDLKDQKRVRYTHNVIEKCNYSIEYFLSIKGDARPSNPSRMEDFVIERNIMWDAGVGFCQQRPDNSQAAHIKSWRNFSNRATGYVVRNNVFARANEMMLEISAGLLNPDGSESMPEMSGNVFIGAQGQRFGVVNQGKPNELVYDENVVSGLGERYAGNVFATYGKFEKK